MHVRIQNFFNFILEPIRDIFHKSPSHGPNLAVLDGLRGMAVILVLTDHTRAFFNTNRGYVGVVLFFVLSGFLLTMPFVYKADLKPNFAFIGQYLIRRFKRIYPLFLVFVTLQYYVLDGIIATLPHFASHTEKFWNYFRFISFHTVYGHFWSIVQEVYFYTLLPIIFLTNHYVLKKNTVLIIIFLLGLTLLSLRVTPESGVYFNWITFSGTVKMRIMAEVFLAGVIICYVAGGIVPKIQGTVLVRLITTLMALLATLLLLFGNEQLLNNWLGQMPHLKDLIPYVLAWQSEHYAIICCFLLFALLINKDGILGKIYSWLPLRAIGVLGYSMYLVHPYVIEFCNLHNIKLSAVAEMRFLQVLFLTYLISSFTYTYIEKPLYKASYREVLKNSWRKILIST